ncbi:MAG TPA: acyltransferase [Burkholderiales bacterium]|nr:acyltransferase [Burkholderiales bacterium]
MSKERVNEIDLLRFVAAKMVLFFHYAFRGNAADDMTTLAYPALAPVAKYGYLGVELFFMISGFVILMTAARGSLRGFVVSRFVRLYPAFWACCTITFLAILAIGAPRFTSSAREYAINMTMLAEFVGVQTMDGAYWSLAVEIRFYAMVAFVLLIGQIRHAQPILIGWLALTVASLALGKFKFLLIADYAPFFIAGATLYLIWERGLSVTRAAMLLASWALAVRESVAQLAEFEQKFHAPISGFTVGVLVTLFFAVMLPIALRRTGSFGARRWVLLGALTYPLYLLHQYIGFMVFNVLHPRLDVHVVFWGTIVLALALAYAVHVLIEKPLAPVLRTALNGCLDAPKRLAIRLKPRAR